MENNLIAFGKTITLQLIQAGVTWSSATQMLVFHGAPVNGIDVNRKFASADEAATYLSGVLHDRVIQKVA